MAPHGHGTRCRRGAGRRLGEPARAGHLSRRPEDRAAGHLDLHDHVSAGDVQHPHDALVEKGYRGIVIAGTGLGHVNGPLYPALERAVASDLAGYGGPVAVMAAAEESAELLRSFFAARR